MNLYQSLSITAVLTLLVGCAGPSPYVTPVEERDVTPRNAKLAPGAVVPVEPRSDVNVAPIYDVPNFAPTQPATQSETQQPAQIAPAEPLTIDENSNSATVSLLAEAKQAADRGDLAGAESQVERALRISPRDPQVYLHLASIKRRQLNLIQAEQVALRGVAVATGLPDYQRKLWRELALIREQAGDAAGAAAARAESTR
jgi:hypothetical protein